MSQCFPPSSEPPETVVKLEATDGSVQYVGSWHHAQDSQGTAFFVSSNPGDTATLMFTGTSVRVLGEVGSDGVKALVGIDMQTLQNGGTTCDSKSKQAPQNQNIPLFDSPQLSQGAHTICITNKGGTLSLSVFEISQGSKTDTGSAPQTPVASPSTTMTIQSISPSSLSVSALPISNGASTSREVGTSLSSTASLLLPPPKSSGDPPPSSSSNLSQTATGSVETGKVGAGASLSYITSSYTEVSTMGGSVVTIVVQTTIEVPQTQPYRGPSRGAVAGTAVGGLLFLFLLVGLGLWWWRRRRNRVRFLYGISNLDFDPVMMTRSSAELRSQDGGGRDSDATLYTGDTLPPYKRPVSYSYLALDVKKHPPSESVIPAVAGDCRLSTHDNPSPPRLPEERSLCESHSASGQESVESVVPPSEERYKAL